MDRNIIFVPNENRSRVNGTVTILTTLFLTLYMRQHLRIALGLYLCYEDVCVFVTYMYYAKKKRKREMMFYGKKKKARTQFIRGKIH